MTDSDKSALSDDVSDEALEAAGAAFGGMPTLMHASYCFTCGSESDSARERAGP
jgi:hypothetical protein